MKEEVEQMSDLGVIALKFSINSSSLKEFDKSLRILKKKRDVSRTGSGAEILDNLLKVIHPITDGIKEKLSESTVIAERNVTDIIKERHNRDWPVFRENILRLESKLGSEHFRMSDDDLGVLDDIADALDAECTNLFQRMGERG
jgi:hypothetical protein